MNTRIDWDSVRAELDATPWEDRDYGEQERLCFLGTVFSLYPSGKYYQPWACSNVDPCPICHGSGNSNPRGNHRQRKRWQARVRHCERVLGKRHLFGAGERCAHTSACRALTKAHVLLHIPTCFHCQGMGSREAYLDSVYQELLEREAEEHNLFITSGEGDPCDVLVGESRDVPKEEECK